LSSCREFYLWRNRGNRGYGGHGGINTRRERG